MDELDDAIIEDAVHCDLCGGPFMFGGYGAYVIIDALRSPCGTLGQLKLCEDCAKRVHDTYRENLRVCGICEHGIDDGEYCEDCNREYKRARADKDV